MVRIQNAKQFGNWKFGMKEGKKKKGNVIN